MLRYTEKEVWKMTPYKILKLYEYHKEYNNSNQNGSYQQQSYERQDDIDIALGGL